MYLWLNKKFLLLFTWTLLVIVLLLSPMPISNAQENVTFIDKVVHAFLFGILSFLIFYWLSDDKINGILNPERRISSKKIKNKVKRKNNYIQVNKLLRIFLTSFFISTSLSIILEYLQAYVPGRSPSDYDLLAGVLGIILVLIFIYGDNYSKKKT